MSCPAASRRPTQPATASWPPLTRRRSSASSWWPRLLSRTRRSRSSTLLEYKSRTDTSSSGRGQQTSATGGSVSGTTRCLKLVVRRRQSSRPWSGSCGRGWRFYSKGPPSWRPSCPRSPVLGSSARRRPARAPRTWGGGSRGRLRRSPLRWPPTRSRRRRRSSRPRPRWRRWRLEYRGRTIAASGLMLSGGSGWPRRSKRPRRPRNGWRPRRGSWMPTCSRSTGTSPRRGSSACKSVLRPSSSWGSGARSSRLFLPVPRTRTTSKPAWRRASRRRGGKSRVWIRR
mmetsp:Transcript_26685/g.68973  ORF Transcript_26685/g.68973 Transcript_26685/m.68973 type:complete len:285 (-) Transcript_26685:1553-2407(-)